MREVEAVKTAEQRQQVEAHLMDQGAIYADIWKVGVNNTALRISDLLSLTMDAVRTLDAENPALNIIEQKTGKRRRIVVNQSALAVMQRRLTDNPDDVWLFQSEAAVEYPTYDWVANDGYNNMGKWIEAAAVAAGR